MESLDDARLKFLEALNMAKESGMLVLIHTYSAYKYITIYITHTHMKNVNSRWKTSSHGK